MIRRTFLKNIGLSSLALPFLPRLRAFDSKKIQRLLLVFSPNGQVVDHFWPQEVGIISKLPRILSPLEPFKDKVITLDGLSNAVKSDGDGHQTGIGCLLTGAHLLPGNIQGGGGTPAGFCSGISIDQKIKQFLQSNFETATRLGSLEFGVACPNRMDNWNRWVFEGSNKPLPPISNPQEAFEKIFGHVKEKENIISILDPLIEDFKKISSKLSPEEKSLLDQNLTFVREMEIDLKASQKLGHDIPNIEDINSEENSNIPKIFKMQMDLIASAFQNDACRVASLQFTNSVGQAKFQWLGINENHHELSHESDGNTEAQEKLVKINHWICEQIAYLAAKLDSIPENGGTMLQNTSIVWVNELGKGNSHTHDRTPFVIVGGGLGFKPGAHHFDNVAHNRLLVSIANAFGLDIQSFGDAPYNEGGPLALS